MRALRSFSLVLGVSLLAGCGAPMGPRWAYPGPPLGPGEVAIVHGGRPQPFHFREGAVYIESVDGEALREGRWGSVGAVEVTPGVHSVGISFDNGGFSSTTVPVLMLSAEAGHSYEIRGEMVKVSFLRTLVQPITCKAHWRYSVVDHEAVPPAEALASGDLPATRSAPILVFPVPYIGP